MDYLDVSWLLFVLRLTLIAVLLGFWYGFRRGRGPVFTVVKTDAGSTITIAPCSHGVEVGDKIVFHRRGRIGGAIGGGIDGSSY